MIAGIFDYWTGIMTAAYIGDDPHFSDARVAFLDESSR